MQDPDDQRLNPPGYPDEDVSFVVDMLKRRDLIGGVDTPATGIIAACLTDNGNDCAEKHNGDFQSYFADRNGGGVINQATNHFKMDGSTNTQIATGPNAKQTVTDSLRSWNSSTSPCPTSRWSRASWSGYSTARDRTPPARLSQLSR